MSDPKFLTIEEILKIHVDQIERYGGTYEIRDTGLLQSALAQPEASFGGEFLHPEIHEMAAAYLFHIVTNHPFVDGNKRTGLVTAQMFLALNDYRLELYGDELEQLVLSVASGKMTKPKLIEVLKGKVVPVTY